MNTTSQKKYLVIRNVCTSNNLRTYLEQICQDENVRIVEEYLDTYSFLNQNTGLYEEHGAKPNFDALLCSYNINKLKYIEYLYNQYEKKYRHYGQTVTHVLNNKIKRDSNYTIGEIGIDITKEINDQMKQWNKDMLDSMCYVEYTYKNNPHLNISCGFRAPDARKSLSDYKIKNTQKQSKFQIFKQKVKKFWDNTGFEIFSSIVNVIEKIFMLIGCVTVLTIILNMVK